jgi:hypothetical protein
MSSCSCQAVGGMKSDCGGKAVTNARLMRPSAAATSKLPSRPLPLRLNLTNHCINMPPHASNESICVFVLLGFVCRESQYPRFAFPLVCRRSHMIVIFIKVGIEEMFRTIMHSLNFTC